MKKRRCLIFFGAGILLIMLIAAGAFLGKQGEKSATESGVLSGAAVTGSAADIDWDTISSGVKVEFAEDFNLDDLNVSMEELNELPVYELTVPEDAESYFRQVGEYFWGESVKDAKFEKTDYDTGSGFKEHTYQLTLKKKNGKNVIGDYLSSFDMDMVGDTANSSESELSEEEKEKEVKTLCEKLHLGIWDGEQFFCDIDKISRSEYCLETVFNGIPVTDYYYSGAWDGEYYGYKERKRIYFDMTNHINRLTDMVSYSVVSKRKMKHTDVDKEMLQSYVDKMVKAIKRSPQATEGLYLEYIFHNAAIRYVFVDVPKDINKGHCKAVPILELTGEVNYYWLEYSECTPDQCGAALNLDTGKTIEACTLRE